MPNAALGLALGLGVGVVLGLLGGGGSIVALPILLYVFRVPVAPAVAMSLPVVGMAALVGFMAHWRQGTVHLRVALPYGATAMAGAFLTARVAHRVPDAIRLGLFAAFAFTAAGLMLRDSMRRGPAAGGAPASAGAARFRTALALQGAGVGVLTSLIGAGGGFVIVPALTLLAGLPVNVAVGSSLLVIAMNTGAGFLGYVGQVPIDWPLVASFTGVASAGAVAGARLGRRVPQQRIKQLFAAMVLLVGAYIVLRRVGVVR